MKGKINSYLTLSAIDGPGLRFVLFMQGCPLKCKYCHNADTIDADKGTEYEIEDIIDIIDSSSHFYNISNGGVTVSGGEPFMQPEYLGELMRLLKRAGYHTAVDTAGSYRFSDFAEILPFIDLVILDTKAMTESVYHDLTTGEDYFLQENLDYLEEIGKPVWLRTVLVPGVNDSEEELNLLKKAVKDHSNIKRHFVIPFSKLGKEKWGPAGLEYSLDNIELYNTEDFESLLNKNDLKNDSEIKSKCTLKSDCDDNVICYC